MKLLGAIYAVLPDEPPGMLASEIRDNLNVADILPIITALAELIRAGRAHADGGLVNRRYWRVPGQ